ncbi:MAG: transglutaminase family protein [Rhodospirillaceae bacterium]|nr:transglutaminase family protein [Rhodospirillaceae bacterium]
MTREEAEETLRLTGALADEAIDVAGTALVLASFDRPAADLARYRAHLDGLAAEVAEAFQRLAPAPPVSAEAGLARRLEALNTVLFADHGYAGDELTYDDPQNANLMRVIDRRRGLPVALSILYLHAARAQGWAAEGLGFPGHFLVRVRHGAASAIVDPFNRGAPRDSADLRRLLKRAAGADAELAAEHYAPASNRAILLRLQNNIRLRLLQDDDLAAAAAVARRMLLIAPAEAALWRELGIVEARRGNLGDAIGALEKFLDLSGEEPARRRVADLIRELKAKLN